MEINKTLIANKQLLRTDLQEIPDAKIIDFINTYYPKQETAAQFTIVKTSHKLGQEGETSIQEIIQSNSQGFIIEKSVGAHAGDFVVWRKDFPSIRILIEIKNYNSNVPSEQYQKFLSDIETTCYAGGIIISKTPIALHREFEISENIMIVTKIKDKSINLLIEVFWKYIMCRLSYGFSDKDYKLKGIQQRLSEIIEGNLKIKSAAKAMRKSLLTNLESVEKTCTDITDKIQRELLEMNSVLCGDTIRCVEEEYFLPKNAELFLNKSEGLVANFCKFLRVIFPEKPLCLIKESKKVEVEYRGGQKIIILRCYLTKISVTFSCNVKDFSNFSPDFEYKNGFIIITIDNHNVKSDVLEQVISLMKN